jgi:polyisoprenoid-binding protein YceI
MLRRMLLVFALAFGAGLVPAATRAAPWQVEPETLVWVEVAWQGRSVAVRFPTVAGSIDFDQNRPERAEATISVSAADATTGIAIVDRLIRSGGYLNAAEYPEINFHLDKLTQTSKSTAEVTGRITLRGVTRPIRFKAEVFRYGAAEGDPARFEAGFNLTGSIDRTEFGSTSGLPEIAAILPVYIRLLMSSG